MWRIAAIRVNLEGHILSWNKVNSSGIMQFLIDLLFLPDIPEFKKGDNIKPFQKVKNKQFIVN